jgi:dihydroxy-acid dehydratase
MAMKLLKEGVIPRQIMTRDAFENAIAGIVATGGSTNGVLHLLAIAKEAGVALSLDDFDRVSRKTPILADMKPWGRFTAPQMHRAGGVRLLSHQLLKAGLLHAEAKTVSGRTIRGEALQAQEETGQQVIHTTDRPIKPTGGLAILRGEHDANPIQINGAQLF